MTIDARTMCLMGLLIAIAALPPRSNRRPLLPARTPITRNRIRRRLRSCRRRRSSCRMYPTTGTISRRTTAAGSRCASASSPSSTTARFHKASEHRPYDKTVWYARRIVPRGKWGRGKWSGDTPTSTSPIERLTAACSIVRPSAWPGGRRGAGGSAWITASSTSIALGSAALRKRSTPDCNGCTDVANRRVLSWAAQRCVEQLDQIAVSDRETFEGLTQFLTQLPDTTPQIDEDNPFADPKNLKEGFALHYSGPLANR